MVEAIVRLHGRFVAVVAVATSLAIAGCVTPPEPLERSHCAHRLNAKVPEPIAFDTYASVVKDANFDWWRGLAAEGVSPEDRVVHAVVGVDGDGSVFCTAIERGLSSSQSQRIRRALERSRYTPAVVGGRPHYSFLHLNVPLWRADDEACARGVAEACEYAATKAGEGGNVVREIELNVKACDAGRTHACARAGSMLARGGVAHSRDLDRGRLLLRKACAAQPRYCGYLAGALESGGAAVDLAEVAALRQRGCEGNDRHSCRRTAWHYENGIGVEQDVPRALAFLDEPCARGDMWACADYGEYVLHGAGIARDVERGLSFQRRACEKEATHCEAFAKSVRALHGLRAAIPHYRRGCDAFRGEVNEAIACRALLYARKNKSDIDESLVGPVDVSALAEVEGKRCRNEHAHCNFAAELVTTFSQTPNEALARELRENGCTDGYEASCLQLAKARHAVGDLAGAIDAARRSCTSGADDGCELHSSLVPRDKHLALLEDACLRRGRCGLLAIALAANDDRADDSRAWLLAKRVAERAGDDAPMYLAGVTDRLGDVSTRAAQSAALMRESCNRGSPSACRALASRYRDGHGVVKHEAKAKELEDRACDLDDFCPRALTMRAPGAAPSDP